MKKQLQLKHKVMIGVGAGLLGATAIATPLAITLTHKNQNSMDVKYGINKKSYNNMKLDLQNKYEAEMLRQGLDQPTRTKRMGDLNTQLTFLDKSVQNYLNTNASDKAYTAGTTALMMKSRELGVNLERKSRANWNEVQQTFNGMRGSFETYMQNHSFDRSLIKTVLSYVEKSYNNMMKEIKASYANDILGGVIKAKTRLISCFDIVNTEIAKLAASIRLNEFMTNYAFTYRVDAKTYSKTADSDMNRVDQLEDDGLLVMDSAISASTMNKMFNVFNNETRQKVNFSTKMIPGYTLTPVYKGIKNDNYSNQQSILIDWTLVSDNVEDASREEATAHLVDVNEDFVNAALNPKNVQSATDLFKYTDANIKLQDYSVFRTSDQEKEGLQDAYFNKTANGAEIELVWNPTIATPWYDGFMFIDQKADSGTLSIRQLAYTNICIKYGNDIQLLKDVIAKVDQENYEPKTVIEKFVKYCDVKANVELTHNTNDVTDVTCAYVASYKNESIWEKVHFQKQSTDVKFAQGQKFTGTLGATSPEFFEQVNEAFNDAYDHSHLFMDTKYKDIALRSYQMYMASVLATAMNGLLIASLAFIDVIYFLTPGKTLQGVFWFIQVLTLSAIFALQCVNDNEMKSFNDPIQDYESRANEFAAGEAYDIVSKMLSKDQSHFALRDKNGNVDPQEMAAKYEEFKALDEEVQQELFYAYSHFETDEKTGKAFFDEARKLEIAPEQFNEEFGDWRPVGKRMIVVLLSNILSAGWIALAQMNWKVYEKFVDAQQRELDRVEQERLDAQISEAHLHDTANLADEAAEIADAGLLAA